MNRNEFWILVGASCLLVVTLVLQIVFTRSFDYAQAQVVAAQQVVSQGNACDAKLRQLALHIYQVSNQTQDQSLKDLLTRQQIIIHPPAATPGAGSAAAPAR